jgi:type II secretory pathway component GspD/PulD (secretin)
MQYPRLLSIATLLAATLAPAQTLPTTTKPVEPPQLKATAKVPINLHVTDESKNIYQTIGKLEGFNVLFDPDYASKQAQVDLSNASLSDALRLIGDVTNTFYKVVTPDTIFVAANTHTKHADFDDLETQTLYLRNASLQADANEIVTAIRNILTPESKVLLVPSDNAIVIRTTPEMLASARAIIKDLDLPKKTYRLTYTLSEMDSSKLIGTQHFAVVMVSGQQTKLKQGSKIPVATDVFSDAVPAGAQTQYTYVDIGINFDTTLSDIGSAVLLKFNIDQSSVAPETSRVAMRNPTLRETSLAGESILTAGKPSLLGSMDFPGSTRRLDVEVLMEPLP